MAYFQNSESNFDQLCKKSANINSKLALKAINVELEEAARQAKVSVFFVSAKKEDKRKACQTLVLPCLWRGMNLAILCVYGEDQKLQRQTFPMVRLCWS